MIVLKKHALLILLTFLLISCNAQHKIEAETPGIITHENNQAANKIPLPEHGFYSGFLDSQGVLWFASRGNGVFKLDQNTFTNFTTKDGLCDDNISCIAEDSKGNLWFGTPNGACRFDRTTFSHFDIPQSDTSSVWLDEVYPVVNPNQVMAVLEDQYGDLWFGTNGAGVYRYDGKTFQQYLSDVGMFYEDGQQHNIILSMAEDLNNDIWFSSLSHGGVSRFDGKEFTHYVNELSDDFVRVVFCDSKGKIWIGTHGNQNGGLDSFDGNTFTAFHKTNDGFSHNNVRWIYEDKSGQLWLGSGTTNLCLFDGKHFKSFEGKDGHTYDKILFVVDDQGGNIWFGSRNGLWKYDGTNVIEMTKN